MLARTRASASVNAAVPSTATVTVDPIARNELRLSTGARVSSACTGAEEAEEAAEAAEAAEPPRAAAEQPPREWEAARRVPVGPGSAPGAGAEVRDTRRWPRGGGGDDDLRRRRGKVDDVLHDDGGRRRALHGDALHGDVRRRRVRLGDGDLLRRRR